MKNTNRTFTNLVRTFSATVSGSLLAAALQVNAAPHMLPGSFLEAPVHSSKELLQEIKSHPAVMHRYMQVFSMSRSQLIHMFSTLRLEPLSRDRVLEVWFVHHNKTGEYTGYHILHLKKGMMVFCKPDGTPVLARVCGNLISYAPPYGTLQPVPEFTSSGMEFNVDSMITPQIALMTPVSAPTDMLTSQELPGAGFSNVIPGLLSKSSGFPLGYFGVLPAFGLFALGGGSHTHNSPLGGPSQLSGSSSQPPGFPLGPPPVPEAGTLPTILAGLGLLSLSSFRRKR